MDGDEGESDAEGASGEGEKDNFSGALCTMAAEAPRAERTAASRSRATKRASCALARLMQAMSRTLRTAAMRSQRREAVLPTSTSFMGWM